MYAARYYDNKGDQQAELDHDVKGNQEAHGPPHVAERLVLEAVGFLRKGIAGAFDARTAAVKAHRHVAVVILIAVS